MRRNRLVWSGFGPVTQIETDISLSDINLELVDYGIRKINVDEPEKLRKFFLSLLWRASVSSLPEMREVKLTEDQERQLSDYLVSDSLLALEFFPCWLTQHHQIGFQHNQTPTKGFKNFPKNSISEGAGIPIFRFYFDGLIVHFHQIGQREFEQFSKNPLTVGFSNELFVTCVPWNKSAQLENIKAIAKESLW